jgi:protein kinase-like protein/putative pyrroloquinoline-quinone binding quinoprotein
MRPLGATDPRTVARYRLLGVLGGGGMGRVYLGQSPTGRRLAIKVIRSDLAEDPVFRLRFTREVQAVRAVSPLFTAAVVDADTDADPPWLATMYLDGPSLRDWVGEHGPLPPGAVLLLAAGLAEALASIHASGLVHRDLKPSNVLLDDAGPRIIDFGIAVTPEATRLTTSLVGTPSYLAPELVAGDEPGPPSDVFSLGATLVFAATGQPLVNSGTMLQQLTQISTGRFDLSAVPRELRPIIVRCLSRRPKDRPTADELVRTLVGSGVPAPEAGWYGSNPAVPARLSRASAIPVSRRRALVLSGLVGVAVAGGGAGVAAATAKKPPTDGTPGPGSILWQARSGARPVGPPAGTPDDDGIVVDRGSRIIAPTGSEVAASDRHGHGLWSRELSPALTGLWQWSDAVLATGTDATGTDHAWLLDAATGTSLFSLDLPATGVRQLALSASIAFLDLGTATVAVDRRGRQVWRQPVGSPLGADGSWLVTRTVTNGTAQVILVDATTGTARWSVHYPAPQVTASPPPDGPPPDGPHDGADGPPPRPQPGWYRSQARMAADTVALRDVQALRVVRRSDGGTVWHDESPTPVAGIELAGDLLLVASGRLTARTLATGAVAWEADIRGARLAFSARWATIVAVGEGRVTGLDPNGRTRWRTTVPAALADAVADRVTIADRTAFVTYRPGPGRRTPLDVDVLAIALA